MEQAKAMLQSVSGDASATMMAGLWIALMK
jgi:hypothetical protein